MPCKELLTESNFNFKEASTNNMYHNKTTKKIHSFSRFGFTLIELLVVIAIIGVLASTVLASVNTARNKARTARRASDLKQISLALELYYNDNNGYPNSSGAWRSECVTWGTFSPSNVIPGIVPTYLPIFPSDPSMNTAANTCCYIYNSNITDYALLDHNCPDLVYTSQPSLEDPTRDGGTNACTLDGAGFWSWKVSSPGGRCW